MMLKKEKYSRIIGVILVKNGDSLATFTINVTRYDRKYFCITKLLI